MIKSKLSLWLQEGKEKAACGCVGFGIVEDAACAHPKALEIIGVMEEALETVSKMPCIGALLGEECNGCARCQSIAALAKAEEIVGREGE